MFASWDNVNWRWVAPRPVQPLSLSMYCGIHPGGSANSPLLSVLRLLAKPVKAKFLVESPQRVWGGCASMTTAYWSAESLVGLQSRCKMLVHDNSFDNSLDIPFWVCASVSFLNVSLLATRQSASCYAGWKSEHIRCYMVLLQV